MADTVKGHRRGSKYPEAVKTACLCDMLVEPNLHRIAKRRGVPESTLRGWYNRELGKMSAEERSALWGEARRAAMREVAHEAAGGARLGVKMIGRRLEAGDRAAKRAEEIVAALLDPDVDADEKDRLRKELEVRPPIGDYPLANFTRTLVSVGGTAAGAAGVDELAGGGLSVRIEVIE